MPPRILKVCFGKLRETCTRIRIHKHVSNVITIIKELLETLMCMYMPVCVFLVTCHVLHRNYDGSIN